MYKIVPDPPPMSYSEIKLEIYGVRCQTHTTVTTSKPHLISVNYQYFQHLSKIPTSSTLVGLSGITLYCLSRCFCWCFWLCLCCEWFPWCSWPGRSVCASLDSFSLGWFQWFCLNLALRSSKEIACRNILTLVFDIVNGSLRGMRPTELTVSLWWIPSCWVIQSKIWDNIPDAEEIDLNVDGEWVLECIGLLPPQIVTMGVHLVCERNLLMVANWQEANFVDHTCKADIKF